MPTLTNNLFYGTEQTHFALDVEGQWPLDIDGYLFNVGPARTKPGGHWFAGQGTILRVDCKPDADGRICVDFGRVESPIDRIRERLPDLFQTAGVLEVSPFGFSNFSNTNVQFMKDRLFLGYDAGRPVEVDPETLEWLTPVGANDEWLQSLPGTIEPLIAVAAHPGPAWDEEALYFANYEMIPLSEERGFRVCRWGLDGPIEHWRLENCPAFDTIHDLKVTRDYIVISDLPWVTDLAPGPPGTRRPIADVAQLFIISKADLRAAASGSAVPYRQLTLPMMAGHITVDYDNQGSEIVVYLSHHPMTDLAMDMLPSDISMATGKAIPLDFVGLSHVTMQPLGIGRYRIDAESGKLLESRMASGSSDFWGGVLFTQNLFNEVSRARVQNIWITSIGYDPELVTQRWWQTYAEEQGNIFCSPRDLPTEAIPGALARVDTEAMSFCDRFEYPAGTFAHPPTFVPRIDSQHDADGYVIVSVHRDGDKALEIFDAQKISAGPIASATAPGFIHPLLLHSSWAPKRQGPRNSSYRIDSSDDAWRTLAQFSANPGAGPGIAAALFQNAEGPEDSG